MFERAGFAPRVVQRGTSPQNLLALVAAGGVTRLPLSSRSRRGRGVVLVLLAGDVACVVLAWRSKTAPPAREPFAAVVREVARWLDPLTAG